MSAEAHTDLHRVDRAILLALATLGIVVATTVASMVAFQNSLPPDDAAFGTDPFAFPKGMVAAPFSLMAFAIAWPLMHFGLRATDLRRSLPVVAATVLLVTPAVATRNPVLAPVCGLAAGALAIRLSRRAFRR
ncbi:MAG: hypothetical protein ABL997_11005 [Planctomycetota bacterium]